MSETGIETQPVDAGAVISMAAALLTLASLCGGIAPIPLTGFVCFPAAVALGALALVAGLVALRRIRASGEAGRTFALVGTAIGGFVLIGAVCFLAVGVWLYPSLVSFVHRFTP